VPAGCCPPVITGLLTGLLRVLLLLRQLACLKQAVTARAAGSWLLLLRQLACLLPAACCSCCHSLLPPLPLTSYLLSQLTALLTSYLLQLNPHPSLIKTCTFLFKCLSLKLLGKSILQKHFFFFWRLLLNCLKCGSLKCLFTSSLRPHTLVA
jgi:hypothetical protein